MIAAIIAAGRGERLRAGGVTTPKPLIRIAGVPMLDRLLDAVTAVGIARVICLLNEEDDTVAEHCRARRRNLDLRVVRRTTPNSMESLFTLAPFLDRGRFLLLTVDAVFGTVVLPSLLATAAAHPDAEGILAVQQFVDDEKPLWIAADAESRVIALGPAAEADLISAGLYVFDPVLFAEIGAARRTGLTALRQFLHHLHARGYRLRVAKVPKTIDVDRPEDLHAAAAFVHGAFAE